MQVGINTTNYNYNCKPKRNTTETINFTASRLDVASDKGLHGIEYGLRIIGNKFAGLFEGKTSKIITNWISKLQPKQDKTYLNALEEISNHYCTTKQIGFNMEDKILERIAAKNSPAIFIMNHSNQSQDPSMLAFLNMLLTRAYKDAGKENTFPLPKIILNQDILTTMNPTKRKAFEAFGAVGIDANIKGADKKANARVFLPLIKDFIHGKCNIFIFPEGRLAIKKYKPLNERFQIGVAEIINKVLGINKEVTVVPVGFAYGKGKEKIFTGMHIGEPVIFKRIGENTTITAGEIKDSEFANQDFVKFFDKNKDKTDLPITESGIPVKPNEISEWIKELLSENLLVCSKKAEINVTNPQNKDVLIHI